jgi:sigma-B regulation protein RsbU (phosphoserine phosphatase)
MSETLISEGSVGGGRARERDALTHIHSALLVQIVAKNSLLGIISLGPRLSELPFSSEDREMLAAVASQIAFAIENARLVHKAVEEERIRRELDMAAQTQRRLFPAEAPRSDAAELAGVCVPARGVGGDYYDFLKFDNRQLGVAVADVAGKGISAALVMSIVQASLRSQAELVRDRPTDLAATMNRLLYSSTYPHDYATFFFAVFDEPTRRLTYVNAGHNPPLVIRAAHDIGGSAAGRGLLTVGGGATATAVASVAPNDRITELTTGGPVIGLFDFGEYEQETVQLQSGDLVVAYTDGVTEALSPAGEEFGEARLRETLLANFSSSAGAINRAVIDALHEWCQVAPQHDDLTLVILKVK